MRSGRSLTAEILARVEASFPTEPERLAALEALVLDPAQGLAALLARIDELERRLAAIEVTPPRG